MQHTIRPYRHYGDCLILDNGVCECILSLGFGPRILSVRLLGRENVFFEQPAEADYLCTPEGWRVYGGTRLWFAPECVHNVYFPDGQPVAYELLPNGARVTQANDAYLDVEKSVTVRFSDDAHTLCVEYAVVNLADRPITGAPWAVSMMRAGAVVTAQYGVAGAAPDAKPAGGLTIWSGTSLADSRLSFTEDCVQVRQAPVDGYFKLGLLCRAGEASCRVAGQVFTKRFDFAPDAAYPDGDVNLELYTCRHMTEFETLAPMRTVPPNGVAAHTEYWTLREE